MVVLFWDFQNGYISLTKKKEQWGGSHGRTRKIAKAMAK
jgi:hypothetical protein